MTDKSKPPVVTRSAFLQGLWKKEQAIIRPPWALSESSFIERCQSQCRVCESACPENIIIIGRGNHPYIDFTKGECTFCQHCVDSCEYGALDKQGLSQPWDYKAVINMEQCITQQSVVCRSCSESCDIEAIQFTPQVGGVSSPELNIDRCTGCGACVKTCPSSAINIQFPVDPDQ